MKSLEKVEARLKAFNIDSAANSPFVEKSTAMPSKETFISMEPEHQQLDYSNVGLPEQQEKLDESAKSTQSEEKSVASPIVQPYQNRTVDSAYTSAVVETPNHEQVPEEPSLFSCFVAVVRALCGLKWVHLWLL